MENKKKITNKNKKGRIEKRKKTDKLPKYFTFFLKGKNDKK